MLLALWPVVTEAGIFEHRACRAVQERCSRLSATGVFRFDVPAWLITILDGAAAYMLWVGYRRGTERPWLGLGLTLAASAIMIGRALWFVIIPLMVVVTIVGSIHRIKAREPA